MQGSLGIPNLYSFAGSPVGVSTSSLNVPAGSLVFDTTNGLLYRKISALGSNATYIALKDDIKTSASTPVAADTVTANANSLDETVYLTPAGTLATLTFTFPTNATSRIGQTITLWSTQIVTTLTVSASGLTLKGTALTALAANTPYTWRKVAASTWVRLQ